LDKQDTNILINNLLFIWATLAAYFAFTDLQISISVVNQNSDWAIFLKNFGEMPGLLVLYSGAVIFIASYKSENKLKLCLLSLFLLQQFICQNVYQVQSITELQAIMILLLSTSFTFI